MFKVDNIMKILCNLSRFYGYMFVAYTVPTTPPLFPEGKVVFSWGRYCPSREFWEISAGVLFITLAGDAPGT